MNQLRFKRKSPLSDVARADVAGFFVFLHICIITFYNCRRRARSITFQHRRSKFHEYLVNTFAKGEQIIYIVIQHPDDTSMIIICAKRSPDAEIFSGNAAAETDFYS